ncbi:uncharacterized protein LOC144744980 [Ciona intestinalis]
MLARFTVVYFILLVSAPSGFSRKKSGNKCNRNPPQYNTSNMCNISTFLDSKLRTFGNEGDSKRIIKSSASKAVRKMWVKSSALCTTSGETLVVNMYRLDKMVQAVFKQMAKSKMESFSCDLRRSKNRVRILKQQVG